MIRFDKAPSEARAEVEKFVVRLPSGMRQAIAEVAKRSRRSMNSEIVARLERSLADTDTVVTVAEQPAQSAPALRAVEGTVDTVASTSIERRLLQAFRKLDQSKRDAILMLLD
jgi:hypothetical protein